MNDPLLMSVLDRLANLRHQFDAFARRQPVFLAVMGDFDPSNMLHHEEWPAALRRPGIEHFGDIGVVH